ncbi:hypothetical protein HAX54_010500, partial [Datura stramonium]|nr:hypothetical protein [Datura stramonium]
MSIEYKCYGTHITLAAFLEQILELANNASPEFFEFFHNITHCRVGLGVDLPSSGL